MNVTLEDLFLILLLISVAISSALFVYALIRRPLAGTIPLALAMLGNVIWSGGYALEVHSAPLANKIFWDNFQFLGVDLLVGGLFAAIFMALQPKIHRFFWILCILPVANFLIVWFYPDETLIRSNASINTIGAFPVLSYGYGPWFWVVQIYTILLIVLMLGVAVYTVATAPKIYRDQSLLLLAGFAFPVIGMVMTLTGFELFPGMPYLDLSPLTFTLANPVIVLAVLHYRWLDLIPAAREQLVEQLPDAVLIVDAQLRVIDCNPSAVWLLGADATKIMNQPLHRWLPEVSAVLQTEQPTIRNFLLQRKNADTTTLFDGTFTRFREDSWIRRGWLIVLRDITNLRQTEQALLQSEQLLQATGRIAQVGGWEYDLASKKMHYSPQLPIIFDLPPDHPAQAFDAWKMYTPESRALIEAAYAEALEHAQPWDLELQIITAKQRQIWIRSQGEAVLSAGRVIKVRAALQDITAQKQTELALQNELEERVRTEQALALAKEEAEAANRAKSEFLANMSHEIRTPLNAVIGLSELLLDTSLNATQSDYVSTVRNSGDALLAIVNDILDFSKIESGHLELEQRAFALSTCFEETLDLVALAASRKQLLLLYQCDSRLPHMVVGDQTRLRQIILNLLSNAVKFTEQGEVLLEVIAAKPYEPHATHVSLQVRVHDTGIGIPPDRMDRLFRSFSQVDSSVTRLYGGTGLGLAISQRIALLMQGEITVESTVGSGSTFTLTLTLPVAMGQPIVAEQPERLAGRRVGLADPHTTSAQILAGWLVTHGAQVSIVPTVEDLLELVMTQPLIDLLVIDQGLLLACQDALAIAINMHTPRKPLPIVRLNANYAGENQISHIPVYVELTRPIKPRAFIEVLIDALESDLPTLTTRSIKQESSTPAREQVKLRILLADDNLINQRVTLSLLERLGYLADVVSDGQQAYEAVSGRAYDVVFMDVQMPHVDGVSATQAIRQSSQPVHQPYIVALTANALNSDRERYLAAGMDDYLSKPVRIEQIDHVLRQVGKKKRDQDQQDQDVESTTMTILDEQSLNRLRSDLGDDDGEMIRELITLFVDGWPEHVAALEASAAVNNYRTIEHISHRLRSSAAYLGAIRLADHLDRLELKGRNQQGHGLAQLTDQVKTVGATTILALQQYLHDNVTV
jgi:signal transduction histidine kinase/DNA-binding NarL/FixJ family response regulator